MAEDPDDADEADEVEIVDDAPVVAGYRLRAIRGPSRWRLGGSTPRFANADGCAYAADGESIWFAIGGSFVHLDRRGRRIAVHRIPGEVWSTTNGHRVAYTRDRRRLVVLELPSMRELLAVDATGHVPVLSGDGEIVAVAGTVHRVSDGAVLDRIEHLTSLSRDGAHAIAARWIGREAEVALHRVGGSVVRRERTDEGLGWYMAWSGDGEHVAWSRRGDVVIWKIADPAWQSIAGRQIAGPIRWMATPEGERVLVSDRSGTVRLAPDGSVARNPLGSAWPLAIAPHGERAIAVGENGTIGEMDLATGARLPGGSSHAPEIVRIAWDPSRPAVMVLRTDGDARICDVESWRTERALDRARGATTTFSRDGARLFFVDASASVTATTRDGRALWTRPLTPFPEWPPGFRGNGGSAIDEGATIRVSGVWQKGPFREPDGAASWEDRRTVTVLDAVDGSVLSHVDDSEVWSSTRSQVLPRIYRVTGATDVVVVGSERLTIDPLLGRISGVYPSPDESILLVTTHAGLLLRFDRA